MNNSIQILDSFYKNSFDWYKICITLNWVSRIVNISWRFLAQENIYKVNDIYKISLYFIYNYDDRLTFYITSCFSYDNWFRDLSLNNYILL